MFAKGPLPGSTPKAEALKVHPRAYCERREALGIRGYVVYIGGQALCSAGTAAEAWRKAASRKPKRHRGDGEKTS